MHEEEEEESLTCRERGRSDKTGPGWSLLQPEVMILERRGRREAVLKSCACLASQQDETWGSRKPEGTALAGDTQTHSRRI